MSEKNVAFIGGGNMARAIAAGLLASGYPPGRIAISEPSAEQREALTAALPGTTVAADNNAVAADADCIVLAVKPQILGLVCKGIAGAVGASRPLIISVAAGIRSDDIDTWLGGGFPIVRVMPNLPALARQGVSGIFANANTSENDQTFAGSVMAAVGSVVSVPNECDIDVVTAISGSGPAYFFLLIDMLSETGRTFGLSDATARTLALQTAVGAAGLAVTADEPMHALIERVRTAGGTTAAALDSLDSHNIRDIFKQALTAARDRAAALADEANK